LATIRAAAGSSGSSSAEGWLMDLKT
jgi:hypothetical protein